MIPVIAHAIPLLLQGAASREATVAPSTFEQITSVADGLLSLVLLAIAIAAIPALLSVRRSYRKVNELVERLHRDVSPLVRHASAIADDVNYITSSIREDVQRINATIASANQKLHEGVEATGERLREFNALLEVVQEEAEELFVNTASAVRGVRGGAAAFRARRGPDLAFGPDDGLDDDDETELPDELEDDDDDERDTEPDPHGSARPRVRRRGRRDRGR